MARVTFIGLGVMGYPMAGHMAAKGHSVTVFNRSAPRAEAWVAQHGGTRAANRADCYRLFSRRWRSRSCTNFSAFSAWS